jgi:hypothetical protein
VEEVQVVAALLLLHLHQVVDAAGLLALLLRLKRINLITNIL